MPKPKLTESFLASIMHDCAGMPMNLFLTLAVCKQPSRSEELLTHT